MTRIKMIVAGAAVLGATALAIPAAAAETPAAPPSSGAGGTYLRVSAAQSGWPMYSAPHSDTYFVGTLRAGEWYRCFDDYRDMPDGRWTHIVDLAGYGGEHYADTAAWVRGTFC